MNKIEIKIPDNLSPLEEAAAIAKRLTQKALSGAGKNKEQKRIGDEVNVIDLETQITVKRVSNEKSIEMVKCNVCGCEHQNNTAVYYWHNYGGKAKKVPVCSSQCQDDIVTFLGNRAAKTKGNLKPVISFN